MSSGSSKAMHTAIDDAAEYLAVDQGGTAVDTHHCPSGLRDDGLQLRVVDLHCCAAVCELHLRRLRHPTETL
jgi:hypothetical protein